MVSLRQTYQRYANLAGSGAVSRQELDNAKSAYEAQAANIESLKQQLNVAKSWHHLMVKPVS